MAAGTRSLLGGLPKVRLLPVVEQESVPPSFINPHPAPRTSRICACRMCAALGPPDRLHVLLDWVL